MITPVTLKNGSKMLLCATHLRLADVESVEPKVQGAKWCCRVCTVHRKLTHGQADAESVIIPSFSGSGATYIVTRVPTGIAYCTCPAWITGKWNRGVPPERRWCKHMSTQQAAAVVRGSRNEASRNQRDR